MDLLFLPLAVVIAMSVAALAERLAEPDARKWLLLIAAVSGSFWGSCAVPTDGLDYIGILIFKVLGAYILAIPATAVALGVSELIEIIWVCQQPLNKP